MKTITNTEQLVPGTWYAVGVENLDGQIEWGGAPIHKYEGDGCWSNEAGEPVETAWDATLQMEIGINEADGYMPQS